MKALYFFAVFYPYVHMTVMCDNVVALDSSKHFGQWLSQIFGTDKNSLTYVNKIMF